jgi:hypothetical protein
MNPDRIFSQYRDDALAKLVTATEYSTFVAMPFDDRFSYRSRKIFEKVIQAAAVRANGLKEARRPFAKPRRADDGSGSAVVITEEIVTEILFSHLFLADLTSANHGVLLEVGVALGLKPNPQILLITQGRLADLHFDIRNNNVISYNPPKAVEHIAKAFVSAANHFEQEANRIVTQITRSLTPDAIIVLNYYGRIQQHDRRNSLHYQVAGRAFPGDPRGADRFDAATRELIGTKLLYTEYKVNAVEGGDVFGMHATNLGWIVITRMWAELKRPM